MKMTITNSNIKLTSDDCKKLFFTSDTHFSSTRTNKFSARGFEEVIDENDNASVPAMDELFIMWWNNTIGEDDIVIHLGDFGNYDIRKQLNGKIILIYGNYEEDDIKKLNMTPDEFDTMLKDKYGFDHIIHKGLTLEFEDGEQIYCTHKPTDCKSNMFNLFGHIHKLQMVKRFGLNVGIDCHLFAPLSYKGVLFYKNAIENHYDDDVFCVEPLDYMFTNDNDDLEETKEWLKVTKEKL